MLLQKDVQVDIDSMDKRGTFFGYLKVNG